MLSDFYSRSTKMTSAELRASKPSTIQERYQIEVAAQVAEMNENFQRFTALMQDFMKQIQKLSETQQHTKRTALVEK